MRSGIVIGKVLHADSAGCKRQMRKQTLKRDLDLMVFEGFLTS